MKYQEYIRSDKWRKKHKDWLHKSGHRCAMFPWIRVGKVGGRYHPYAMHHMDYSNLGKEKLWLDVIPLSKFAHDHIIHGFLSGWKPAGKQRLYPNTAQRIVHIWCRVPPPIRLLLALGWIMFFAKI